MSRRDAVARIEAPEGILEHRLDVTAKLGKRRTAAREEVGAEQAHAAFERRIEGEHNAGQRRLPAAGFADEADVLATAYGEPDAVYGAEISDGREQGRARQAIGTDDLVHLEQRRAVFATDGSPRFTARPVDGGGDERAA